MNAPATDIPVRSQAQALDWSLVLISQGIESVPEEVPESGGWRLVVSPQDFERAMETLRLYQAENRPWPWRQELFHGELVFDWAGLAWSFLMGLFYWLSVQPQGELRVIGTMDSAAVKAGEWWRLFTAVWLHGDLAHLAANATLGVVLLGLALGRFGTGIGLLAAYLAGVGGNVGGLFSVEVHRSLGASGMVMGALGLVAAQSISLYRSNPRSRKLVATGLCGGVMLFVLLGVAPGTDIVAHAGGFIGGVGLGALMVQFPRLRENARVNFLATCLFVVLVVGPWWLAFRRR
jgi:membrane associated rhomboid family serine protease